MDSGTTGWQNTKFFTTSSSPSWRCLHFKTDRIDTHSTPSDALYRGHVSVSHPEDISANSELIKLGIHSGFLQSSAKMILIMRIGHCRLGSTRNLRARGSSGFGVLLWSRRITDSLRSLDNSCYTTGGYSPVRKEARSWIPSWGHIALTYGFHPKIWHFDDRGARFIP